MNIEEALAQAATLDETLVTPVDDVFLVDPENRIITVPESEKIFGVYGENDVERKHFKCPKIILDNVDLSKCSFFVNYIASSGKVGQYMVDDLESSGDYVTFSWLLTSNVFDENKDATIYFSVQAKNAQNKSVFCTKMAEGEAYETSDGTGYVEQEYADVILRLISLVDGVTTDIKSTVQKVVDEYMKNNPVTVDTTLTVANKPADSKTTGDKLRDLVDKTNQLKEDLGDKTKNLDKWNLIDISKVKNGYGYTNSIGYPPTLVAQDGYNAIDDVISCNPEEIYTVNWLYGAIGIYDANLKRIEHIYIDAIPKTFTIPDGGYYMTLFGGAKRMTDIMLVKGNEIPRKYVNNSIFDIKIKDNIKLYGVKWCAFGDSLTDSATLANEISGTKNYVDYVSESLGLVATNCGKGGTGYLKSANFMSRVETIPTDTELLTVFGSFNDYEFISENLDALGDTGTDTIYGAMYNFINGVFARCPDVVMGIITPTKWGYLSEWKGENASELCEKYVKALIETAEKWSIPVLDLYHTSGLRPWDSAFAKKYYKDDNGDGTANTVHPLDEAHKRFIAPKVEAFIKQIYHVY